MSLYRHFGVGRSVVLSGWGSVGKRLQQVQLAGAGDGFGAALHLEFVKDPAVVPFDRVQGQEQPLADLPVRESLDDQL